VRIDNLRSDDSGGPNLLAKKYALSSLSFNIASSGVGTFGGGALLGATPSMLSLDGAPSLLRMGGLLLRWICGMQGWQWWSNGGKSS
jgi:hypothetical protein